MVFTQLKMQLRLAKRQQLLYKIRVFSEFFQQLLKNSESDAGNDCFHVCTVLPLVGHAGVYL